MRTGRQGVSRNTTSICCPGSTSEQAELAEKIEQLQSAIAAESQSAADAEKWIALMKECVNPTELTAEL